EQELYGRHAGRPAYDARAGGWPEVVMIVGRQSGKSRIASTIAAYEAAISTPEPDGMTTHALLIAQDHRASMATLFGYAAAPFEKVPTLRRLTVPAKRTVPEPFKPRQPKRDSLALVTGCTVSAYPCSAGRDSRRARRGGRD